jgi:hypothetical protein
MGKGALRPGNSSCSNVAEGEHCPRTHPEEDERAVAARSSFSRPRHPLLDDAAAEIRINQAPIGACHRLA